MTIGDQVKMKVEPLKTYFPFSDVNQHCIYFIDDFLVENTDESTVPAFTLPQIHYRTGRIYDADIFMMRKGFKKQEEKKDDQIFSLPMITKPSIWFTKKDNSS